ncbi:MAG: SUMF1/EgtB/PvdO family nonheme iron enzyme, partial [bacterium]|nr:SUMF1/EgtB/PvdO family nonheme iron enzyme [bacterium]
MDNIVKHIPEVIEKASRSLLGVFSLMVIVMAIIGILFFKNASEPTRIAIFVMLFSGLVMFGFAFFRARNQRDAGKLLQQESKSFPENKKPALKELSTPGKKESKPNLPSSYCRWIDDCCAYMELDNLQGKGQAVRAELPEIFIPLFAYDPEKTKGYDPDRPTDKEHRSVDITRLIGNQEYLLIGGHAGSGKTTLLKYLAYVSSDSERLKRAGIPGLETFQPILIFLKDLKALFKTIKLKSGATLGLESMVSFCFDSGKGILEWNTALTMLKNKSVLLLLDGMDEIEAEQRKLVVDALSLTKSKYPGNKFMISGRPHGLAGPATDIFGRFRVEILPLETRQIDDFIRKWFHHVYPKSEITSAKTAEEMIGDIKDHPAVGRLIGSPLMLTAICILYHAGKELPGQRAELYKKFVGNLLHRRFSIPEEIQEFLSTLAFKMQLEGTKTADKSFAVNVLKSIKVRQSEDPPQTSQKRLATEFDAIEADCGLLKYEDGSYMFWHLTFQEYLAAVYIVDNHTQYDKAIEPYWDDSRYKEVIELYIGYLSIENKKWANQIVEKTLDAPDGERFKRWRLAARSFLDIHEKRREPHVKLRARERLVEIISKGADPRALAEAGETLGWLGDPRELKTFAAIEGGSYDLEGLGTHTMEPFEIGRYPVTNVWFAEFMAAGGYKTESFWSRQGKKWLHKNEPSQPVLWNERRWRCPNAPVVGVCWYEADAFCRWLTTEQNDGHTYFLPSEVQWQAAAAGKEKRNYPWGKEITPDHCNYKDTKLGKTSAVGIFKIG